MKWTELSLEHPQTWKHRNGGIITLEHAAVSEPGVLRILIPGRDAILLPGAVDVSEQLDHPRILMVQGLPDDRVLTLGGPKSYFVHSRGEVQLALELHRFEGEEEYWELAVTEVDGGLLVVYEGGVLFIDPQLVARWHCKKYFNDVLTEVTPTRARLVRDDDSEWEIDLRTGETIEVPGQHTG